MKTTMEFDVDVQDDADRTRIIEALSRLKGVERVEVTSKRGCVLVQSNLPSSIVLEAIEATGPRAVLKGYGGASSESKGGSSAVAMLGGPSGHSSVKNLQGVVRLVQSDPSTCVIEGTIDGLRPGLHGLHIHECGDLSQGCLSVGDHFDLSDSKHGGPSDPPEQRHIGDLGNIEAGEDGRAVFRIEDPLVKVQDVIGRSVVITEEADDLGKGSSPLSSINGNSGARLACGIISRSAGLFENSKKICACDGVTLWDERDKPLAGPGRSML